MQISARNIIMGFVAAAIAVVLVHQSAVWLSGQIGLIKAQPWSFQPIKPFGIPTILNSVFWGGVWGALYAVIWQRLPSEIDWVRGLMFGLLILLVSNWILLPLIKGTILGIPGQAYFAGFDLQRMMAGILILGSFGIALGVIYGLLSRRP